MDYSLKTLSQLRPILIGFRKAAGLTQAAAAARLGVTQQTYAQLEANPAAVSVERLFKVLRVLDVELALTRAEKASEATPIHPPPPIAAKAYLLTDYYSGTTLAENNADQRENW